MTAEDAVRAYFAAYSEGRPERFDEIISTDYVDYGHTPPGHGPQGRLYRVIHGRIAEARHAIIGQPPA